jgi:hypothetical protein
MNRHAIFGFLWKLSSLLLVASLLFLAYSAVWEYSMRRYLKGFVEAIVPEDSTPAGRVEAIIAWMRREPLPRDSSAAGYLIVRDPENTLNSASLLAICGSATNAFVNLSNTSGVPARRLLLLNADAGTANHVVAEVLIDGRWLVVDPVFRIIPRGPDGAWLSQDQLRDPQLLLFVTRGVPNYRPDYNYLHTSHLRMGRLPLVGKPLGIFLDRHFPRWEDSVFWTLITERESFAALLFALLLFLFALCLRLVLRWYARSRLGLRSSSSSASIARAAAHFFRGPC